MKEKINKLLRRIFGKRLRPLPENRPVRLAQNMQITLNGESQKQIQHLMDKTENRSPSQLFRKALATYDLLTEHVAQEGKVVLRSSDGTEIIFDPISFKKETEEE